MKIHFIAIGGSAMHNLALAMHNGGHKVTGSDDEIFEPSKSRLAAKGLLPENSGWYPGKISSDIDAVILGMHARSDNSELLKAKELNLPIFSYPEFLYNQTKNKTRIVVGGSHGKTTVTAMIMHVLKNAGVKFDYMVGSLVQGFETMVAFSDDAKIAVFEGDEYLSSPIDLRPKFHLYKPHVAIITGIAWDHVNVFPTFENYVEQFRIFTDLIEKDGVLIYYENDKEAVKLAEKARSDIKRIPYKEHPNTSKDGNAFLIFNNIETQVEVFGSHNMQNIMAAYHACETAGVSKTDFYKHISTFTGAAKRLQKITEMQGFTMFLDFAHSPSKVKATTDAVKKQFPDRKVVACFELHTFSSMSESFLPEYKGTVESADIVCVFVNAHAFEMKRKKPFSTEQIVDGFGRKDIFVAYTTEELQQWIKEKSLTETTVLLMSSGNFNGMNLSDMAKNISDKLATF